MNTHRVIPQRRLSRLSVFAIAGFVAALSSLASIASAASPVDQSYLPSGAGATYFVESGQSVAQTFTAGRTGLLTDVAVELELYGGSSPGVPITVQIMTLTGGGLPDGSNIIGSGTISASDVPASPTVIDVSLAVAPQVAAGTQYAIVLSSTAATCCSSGYYTTDSAAGYAPGKELVGSSWSDTGNDMGFVTYVAAAAPAAEPRGAYCTVTGNTSDTGGAIQPATFVNLDDGQAWSDPHYLGATPANFVQGVGLTCAAPPAGYTRRGFATADMDVDSGIYPYYSN